MRKPLAMAIFLAIFFCLAACGEPAPPPAPQSMIYSGCVAGEWFSEELPEGARGSEIDPGTLRVGRTYDGKDIFALLRVAVPADIDISLVREAWLCLKIAENNGGSALLVGAVTQPWDGGITREGARALVGPLEPARQALAPEGWLQVDITEHVKAWSGGEPGLALFEGNGSTETVFDADGGGEYRPRLELILDTQK